MSERRDHVVIIPVKSPGTAKSRLTAVSREQRARLAAAFATDVVDAALRTPGVVAVWVVSDDDGFAHLLAFRGARVCADPGMGLNAALRAGAAAARAVHPAARPVALFADLPCLTSDDLAAALAELVDGIAAFVADADGSGSSLYSAEYDDFDPCFGVDSAAAHRAAGAVPLQGTLATLRRDVDDLAGLADAMTLGVGPATSAVVA
ncbi:2-phospho-L-lactate guanylyltransferase [Nocardioides caeni]|uniref:2-phospho-L-lactate guanylyltransferase n=1 Tax=Nocardioides caeni TaxID=574700 RepID=A0A4S8NL46_9ACTN|nr:2-phospho-L-lactate guanylyltransferase [Nocardioides caeni]THV17743.1 2-phospho-L-lactate guanylyltransferase [Nocardioides caeni]